MMGISCWFPALFNSRTKITTNNQMTVGKQNAKKHEKSKIKTEKKNNKSQLKNK